MSGTDETVHAADGSARNRQSATGTKPLSVAAGVAIVVSVLLMLAAALPRNSATVAKMPRPAGALPVQLPLSVPDTAVTFMLWAGVVLGGAGVIAGLAAVARGARYPAWLLLTGGLVAVAAFTILPPAGSTDTVSYAAYGRIAALGYNPYLVAPAKLARLHDPVGIVATHLPYWHYRTSLYGPIATAEQWAAARLGGSSVYAIVGWLKLWNAIMFAAIALGLDRLLRSDPARRTRVHLLWTVNPLLLWALIAGGHLDVLAAGFGFAGLMILRARPGDGRVPLLCALGAGLLVGLASDVILDYLLFAPALAWALRRQPAAFASAAAGVFVTLVPISLLAGTTYFRGFASRNGIVGADSFYQLISPAFRHQLPTGMALLVDLAFAGLALLLLWGLPDGPPGLPAIRPALAVSLAWLFLWYYTLPWYDTMAVGLLAVYPASRLDWAVIGQFTIATFANVPGLVFSLHPHWLSYVAVLFAFRIMPLLLLAALIALVGLCASRRWEFGRLRRASGAGPPTLSGAAARPRLITCWGPAAMAEGGAGGAVGCGCCAGTVLVAA